jgi:hypothetical protein
MPRTKEEAMTEDSGKKKKLRAEKSGRVNTLQ